MGESTENQPMPLSPGLKAAIQGGYDDIIRILTYFSKTYTPEILANRRSEDQTEWGSLALHFWRNGRRLEAVELFDRLYASLIEAHKIAAQESPDSGFVHKGMVLYYLGLFFRDMGYPVLAKRHLMLSLIEDSIRDQGDASKTGVFYELVWQFGLSDALVRGYSRDAYQISKMHPVYKTYPEAILQELDQEWMTELPSPGEALYYRINQSYLAYLRTQLNIADDEGRKGKGLEYLADYLLSCMPGCRTTMRMRSFSTDYDIVCSLEGFEMDFRSELGRYFVCECKDKTKKIDESIKERVRSNLTNAPATFGEIAKFCRVLDSVKARFGIVFSPGGITGDDGTTEEDAARELLKMFHDSGTVVVVIDARDLDAVAKGQSFISILHDKYETARLDLRSPTDEDDSNQKPKTRLKQEEEKPDKKPQTRLRRKDLAPAQDEVSGTFSDLEVEGDISDVRSTT